MQDSYREIFLSESQEYLKNISSCLVKLESNPADLKSLNEIFRCAHTLKGMSATMGYDKIAALTHQMEDLLDELRGQKMPVTSEIVDALFSCIDILEQSIQDVRLNQDSNIDFSACILNLKKFLIPEPASVNTQPGHTSAQGSSLSQDDTSGWLEARKKGHSIFRIKITIAKNCPMKEARAFLIVTHLKKMGEILQAVPSLEDLSAARFDNFFTIILASKERQEEIHQDLLNISEVEDIAISLAEDKSPAAQSTASAAAGPEPAYVKKIQSMRIPVQRLDRIMNLIGELTIAKIQLMQMVETHNTYGLEEISITLDRLTSTLQDEIMHTRLLPASYILDAFSRLVRDLSHKLNKDVALDISGGEIELDRIVLDEISDPLIHLLRNSVDHGIEEPQERKAKGKNPKGKISILVSRQKGQIYIEVADDGKGIDIARVRAVAVEKKLLTEAEAANLDERKTLELIAMPGFSTAKKVTDVSGRGVGLDVVKIKIESLGGRLEFETKPEEGTRFILTLPLTLAIIKAMLVKVHQEILLIPLMNIRETIKVKPQDIKLVHNFQVVNVRDEVIPILRMDKELDIPDDPYEQEENGKKIPLIIIEYRKKALGLVVSKIVGEQDIVVKPLPSFVKRTKGIAGATILGDGKVALILDVMSLR
ncbi:chemotaxis protein CheA [bacterium]|nr:MAG: chemotaxis protein CheA [bacterium]